MEIVMQKIKKDCKVSLDGVNVVEFKKGDNVENPSLQLIELLGERLTKKKYKTEESEESEESEDGTDF